MPEETNSTAPPHRQVTRASRAGVQGRTRGLTKMQGMIQEIFQSNPALVVDEIVELIVPRILPVFKLTRVQNSKV